MGHWSGAALLFDLDGVLVDSRACIERIWREWAAPHGLDPEAFIGVAHGRRTSEVLRQVVPDRDIAADVRQLDRMEAEATDGLVAAAGAAALLATLRPLEWAVVTSGSRDIATRRLHATGLPLPATFITGDAVIHGKPHPEAYLAAARRLGREAAECLVLEDAPAGVRAGKAAGMFVLAVASTHAASALGDADAVVGRLADVSCARAGGRLRVAWT